MDYKPYLLENITFGSHFHFHFETVLLLRDPMLLNGLNKLRNMGQCSAGEAEEFESLARLFFRRLLETPSIENT